MRNKQLPEKDFNVLLEKAACYDIIKSFLDQLKNEEMTDSVFTEHVKRTIDVATDRLDKLK